MECHQRPYAGILEKNWISVKVIGGQESSWESQDKLGIKLQLIFLPVIVDETFECVTVSETRSCFVWQILQLCAQPNSSVVCIVCFSGSKRRTTLPKWFVSLKLILNLKLWNLKTGSFLSRRKKKGHFLRHKLSAVHKQRQIAVQIGWLEMCYFYSYYRLFRFGENGRVLCRSIKGVVQLNCTIQTREVWAAGDSRTFVTAVLVWTTWW